MLMVKATRYGNLSQVPEGEDLYGTLVADNIVGVVHDHFVTFYLDMDVDGPSNSFVKVHMETQETAPGESPRKSYMKVVREVARTEEDAKVKLKLYDPSEFHVVNPSRLSKLGNPSGYKLVPGATAASLLDLDDPPQKRAAFTNNQVMIMSYALLLGDRSIAMSFSLLSPSRYGSLHTTAAKSGRAACSRIRATGTTTSLFGRRGKTDGNTLLMHACMHR